MTAEILIAIGQEIVTPICFFAFMTYFIYRSEE